MAGPIPGIKLKYQAAPKVVATTASGNIKSPPPELGSPPPAPPFADGGFTGALDASVAVAVAVVAVVVGAASVAAAACVADAP